MQHFVNESINGHNFFFPNRPLIYINQKIKTEISAENYILDLHTIKKKFRNYNNDTIAVIYLIEILQFIIKKAFQQMINEMIKFKIFIHSAMESE